MSIRLATLAAASILTLSFQAQNGAQAQGLHSDRALNYLLGQWYSLKSGRLIEFYISRDIPKFSDSYGPEGNMVGSYRAGEAGADYVLEYPTGLKCYYDVRIGAGQDVKEIIFALRRAVPEHDGKFCIEGPLHKQADRR